MQILLLENRLFSTCVRYIVTISRRWHDEVKEIAEKFIKILCVFEFYIQYFHFNSRNKKTEFIRSHKNSC